MPVAFEIYSGARTQAKRLRMLSTHSQSPDPTRTPQRQGTLVRLTDRALIVLLLLIVAPTGAWPTPANASVTRLTELPGAWRDDRGQLFDLRTLQGHAIVLTMAYATCHRVCPLTMRRLQQLQRDLDRRGASAEFLVIGYDPDNDDPAAWRQYRATRHLTRSNWHFLVGTRAAVEQTARQLGFEFWKMDQHVVHDSRILYFDEHGTLVGSDAATEPQSTQR